MDHRATAPFGIVMDLDDTLYLERDYVESGFRAIDAHLRDLGVEGFAEACRDAAGRGIRGRVFDTALARLDVRDIGVTQLVALYRSHKPRIALAPDARRFLKRFAGCAKALVSDGPLPAQSAKVEALGLDDLFDAIVLTDRWGREFWKPHERAFRAVEDAFALPASRLVYVADNPAKDFVTPRALGWRTLQVARRNRVHHVEASDADHAADAAVEDLDAGAETVAAWFEASP